MGGDNLAYTLFLGASVTREGNLRDMPRTVILQRRCSEGMPAKFRSEKGQAMQALRCPIGPDAVTYGQFVVRISVLGRNLSAWWVKVCKFEAWYTSREHISRGALDRSPSAHNTQ
jgi:hypothetical protein